MTGQRIVFDREKLVLGWKKFNCKCFMPRKHHPPWSVSKALIFFKLFLKLLLSSGYDIENSSTLPINRRNTTAMPPSVAGVPSSYNPEATIQNGNESQVTVLPVPPVISHSSHSCSCFIYTHLVLLILLLAILWSFFFLLFFSHWNIDPSPVWSYSFPSSGLVYMRLLVSWHFFSLILL